MAKSSPAPGQRVTGREPDPWPLRSTLREALTGHVSLRWLVSRRWCDVAGARDPSDLHATGAPPIAAGSRGQNLLSG